MKRAIILFTLIITSSISAIALEQLEISGTVDWESMRLDAEVSLDLASVGLRLPSGRTQAEALLGAGYLSLIRPHLFNLQADSSSTIGDLVARGELSLLQTDVIARSGINIPPAMRPDMRKIYELHTIYFSNITYTLARNSRPNPVIRTLNPVSSARYTGIIIIAAESLPIHGMRSSVLPVPCLFPKIWDTDMNLIYDKTMLEARNVNMVRYSSLQNIFQENPSGLTAELRQAVGERPLRIFARGVFGINPTDLIIDRNDALLIISGEENRNLLSQGRVVIVLDDSVLKYNFGKE